jgi:hypothetical protein
MAHACNIDSKGRLVRGIGGFVAMVVALVLLFAWALPTGGVIAWVVVASALAFGLFGMYEAYHGWCAARALGFKTSI